MVPEDPIGERVVGIRPGRSILLSPDWSDEGASIAFDGCSGDYFVIPTVSRRILALIAEQGPQRVSDLAALPLGQRGIVAANLLEQVVGDLEDAGLLAAVEPGRR